MTLCSPTFCARPRVATFPPAITVKLGAPAARCASMCRRVHRSLPPSRPVVTSTCPPKSKTCWAKICGEAGTWISVVPAVSTPISKATGPTPKCTTPPPPKPARLPTASPRPGRRPYRAGRIGTIRRRSRTAGPLPCRQPDLPSTANRSWTRKRGGSSPSFPTRRRLPPVPCAMSFISGSR